MSNSQEDSYEDDQNSFSSDSELLDADYADEQLIQQGGQNQQKQDFEESTYDKQFSIMKMEDKIFYDRIRQEMKMQPVPKQQRCTLNCITKYEYTKVIGVRANQINANSPIYVNLQQLNQLSGLTAIKIAQQQFRQKKLPFIIRRYLPEGKYQEWKLQELQNNLL